MLKLGMFNWTVDEEYFQKQNPEAYQAWRLVQLINYGLDGEKLSKSELRKYWPEKQSEKLKTKVFKD